MGITVFAKNQRTGEAIVLGWVNFFLFSFENKLQSGTFVLPLWKIPKPNSIGKFFKFFSRYIIFVIT